MNTQEIREEFNPEPESQLDIALAALDIYRERAEELRGPAEELRQRLEDTKAVATGNTDDFEKRAAAATLVPILREAEREARTAYQRARGKARRQEADVGFAMGTLRRYKAELAAIDAWRGGREDGGEWVQQEGVLTVYAKPQEAAQVEARNRAYLARWLEPDNRPQTALMAMVREARALAT